MKLCSETICFNKTAKANYCRQDLKQSQLDFWDSFIIERKQEMSVRRGRISDDMLTES